MRTQSKLLDDEAPERTVRASVSFPARQYEVLEQIAADNKVSLAWVVRDAIDDYLKFKWPLLPRGEDTEGTHQK